MDAAAPDLPPLGLAPLGLAQHSQAPAPPYYLSDFHAVLEGVEARYAPLLTVSEQAYIRQFRALSPAAQLLYVRLVNRKGPYFRIGRLDYPEIGALAPALAELAEHRLLELPLAADACRPKHLLACFTLPELRATLRPFPAPKTGRAELLGWLAAWPEFGIWARALIAEHPLVGVPEHAPWPFLKFLFFGELRDNLSDFVTRALGHIVTESFDAAKLHPYFTSRAQADDAFRMARLYQEFATIRDELAAAELLAWWQNQDIRRQHLAEGQAWFDRLVDRLGRRLERDGLADAALNLYATSPVAPARERQARLLLKAGRKAEASTLLQAMAATPCQPAEAYAARQLLARLEKTSRRSEGFALQQASRTIRLHYRPRAGFGGTGNTVEAAVLEHYRNQGWHGVHAENWLWNASFGLLLWDIIYDPGLGVFHSPLQFAPSDLYSPEFYRRRQQAMEARLALLRQPAAAFAVIARHIEAKQGLANPFVAWHEGLPEILSVMLHRVPPDGHAAVLRHMARDLRHHAHGFVDLFIWNADDYRFIEIKSRNDKLAPHQFEWLRFFAEVGIKAALENVVPPTRQAMEGAADAR